MTAHHRIILPIAVLLLQAGCTQPAVDCTSAHGEFAVRYDFKKGDKTKPCGQLESGVMGMQTYYAEGGVNGTPKFSEASLAMRSAYLYDNVYARLLGDVDGDAVPDYADNCVQEFNPDQLDEDMDMIGDACGTNTPVERKSPAQNLKDLDKRVGDPDALGDFATSKPDGEGFCEVPKVSKVTLNFPEILEIPGTPDDPATPDADETVPPVPGQAAADLVYAWDNLKFLVTADAQGTQFSADLKFTQDGCTAEYHVVGLYPAYGCAVDEDCHDEASPINPDFPVKCSAQGLCVLKGEPPAYE